VVLALDTTTSREHLSERDLAIAVDDRRGGRGRGPSSSSLVPEGADPTWSPALGGRSARSSRTLVRDVTPLPPSRAQTTSCSFRSRPGGRLLPRRGGDCGASRSVLGAVPTRPHAGAGLVTGTTTLVGSRRTA
jgi:hypothetical protein